ncbi:hypothetical protein TA3x_002438 [Tundrisphaera sp. TA3]|uniref:hypothetical protein n=1 Tax=Tundrisphaera sp. TA3 TaxID=3435775 RepID=UPI003EB81B8E
MTRRMVVLFSIALLARSALANERMRTFDGKHPIDDIEVTFVYFVPEDREPLADWHDRLGYFAKRIEAFHRRELDGQSNLKVIVRPEPFRSAKTAEEVRGNDPNATFYNTVNETRKALKWPGESRKAFPILLVLSEINWRELDDFRRTRVVDGKEVHEGNIGRGGRHFPGAESGGARATYWSREGFGLGLVSADGWRVPYSGSDCVVYHEGVGHTIGLPHPEPVDGSVMGVAQYQGWINETFLNVDQKKKLNWLPPQERRNDASEALFTAFTALQDPTVPKAGEPVALRVRWPAGAKVKSLRIRYQTELAGPWIEGKAEIGTAGEPPARVPLATFERATPVSYRVDAALEGGEAVEIWGYFQVK